MAKYTFSRQLTTIWYTTVEADGYTEAQRIANDNFDDFENLDEGDGEWGEDTEVTFEEEE
jgi:hypothetical protein